MNEKTRKILKEALSGDINQWIVLADIFWNGNCYQEQDMELSRLCLEQAKVEGNSNAYCLYHQRFSKGEKVIDNHSYRDMLATYVEQYNQKVSTKEIEQYLNLGTKEQQEMWNQIKFSLKAFDGDLS